MGVRRHASAEGIQLGKSRLGELFEQQIGLECLKYCRKRINHSLHFWRDPNGPEVDWIIKKDDRLIPIEVKWSENPDLADSYHLQRFTNEYKEALPGLIVSRVKKARLLKNGVRIIPWQELIDNLDT